jgi:hypothetical protein
LIGKQNGIMGVLGSTVRVSGLVPFLFSILLLVDKIPLRGGHVVFYLIYVVVG